MTAPNMAAITASLERSLQNFSLDDSSNQRRVLMGEGIKSSSSSSSSTTSDDPATTENPFSISDTSLELNSHLSLPYHWEQCLDLKTGEIYYINWMTGMKSKEDPRSSEEYNGDFYSEDDNSSYNSEESSSESSPPSSSRGNHFNNNNNDLNINNYEKEKEDNVLVVAGCKSCLMYYMVPKQVEDCPKCTGQLLHFDRFENGSS